MAKKSTRREFIKNTAIISAAALGSSYMSCGKGSGLEFDIIIKNGKIINGRGSEPFSADIGIIGEEIVAIGDLRGAKAPVIVDAKGKIVCPGFIDIHSHTDANLLIYPRGESMIMQGVTTTVGGNCGSSPFPVKPEMTPEKEEIKEKFGLEINWTDLAGLYERMEKNKIGMNIALQVGQGTVREMVLGEEQRAPNKEELQRMKDYVKEAMEQGAIGISTGLEYTPSGFASTEELIELCKVAARYGGLYSTHCRSEDTEVVEAYMEAIEIAKKAEIPLEISHVKAAARPNWGKMDKLLELINKAAQEGVSINGDRYPYTAYSTGLTINFPQWALEGGTKELIKRLKDKKMRSQFREEVLERIGGVEGFNDFLLIDMEKEENKYLIGKRLGKAATERNLEPYEFLCDLIISEDRDVGYVGFGMSEDNTRKVLTHPLIMVCSDGSAMAPTDIIKEGSKPHPRNFGTFPRVIRKYVREEKLLTLPEAIKKMTSMAAEKAGLTKRGLINKDYFADIVIFDFEKIEDKATFIEPVQYPVGIDYILVNGTVVVDHGKHTGALPGKVLRRA
jgi:N-acyl-D-amino-acid deacylase